MSDILQGVLGLLAVGGIIYWVLRRSRANKADSAVRPATPVGQKNPVANNDVDQSLSDDTSIAEELFESSLELGSHESLSQAMPELAEADTQDIAGEDVDDADGDEIVVVESTPDEAESAAALDSESSWDPFVVDEPEGDTPDVAPAAMEVVEEPIEPPQAVIPDPSDDAPPPIDLSIDAALADEMTLAEEPAPPPQASPAIPPARSLPPKRSSVANRSAPDTTSTAGLAASSGAIPPRRYPLGEEPQPRPVNPMAPSAATPTVPPEPAVLVPHPAPDPEPEEIEVLDARSTIPIGEAHSTSESAAEDTYAMDELRLALEASHNELSHLTIQRDQVATRAADQEKEIERLRAELDEFHAAQELLQQQRDRMQQLEAELGDVREQLDQSRSSTSAIEQDHAKHQATMEELRIILAEREAMEASLGRERDNLVAQNEDLQRRLDNASISETQFAEQQAAEQATQQIADQAAEQIAALSQRNQQNEAQLSLSNETIRQLNQNINHRDAELVQLRQQVQTLQSELEASETESSDAVVEASVIQEIQQQHETHVAELRQIIADRDATIDEQSARHSALEVKLAEVEAVAAESPDASELSLATETIRQLNQTLLARDAELIKLRGELQQAASDNSDASDKLDDELQRMRQELDEAQSLCAEFESLQASLRAKTADFDALQAEHHTLKVRFESEVGALKSKLESQSSQRDLETLRAAEQELKELTDRQAAELKQMQEEQSELRQQVSELYELKASQESDLGYRQQLEEENREYRRSVAELHASLNELEEFKLEREREKESARQKLQEAVLANSELTAELARLKLKNELAEQHAVARATGEGANPTDNPQHGQSDDSATVSEDAAQQDSSSSSSMQPTTAKSAESSSGSTSKTKTIPSKSRRSAQADDLKQISGIGPALEKRLNSAGIYRFEQIKAWSKTTIKQLDEELRLGGRIVRDQWVVQAKKLDKK